MEIFLDQEDYKFFLFRLKENLFPPRNHLVKTPGLYVRKSLPADSFTLLSYCLMPNHFHLLIRQNGPTPVSKLISKICTSYSKYFNKKYERVGHVFQDAFKAIIVDSDSYLLWLSAYIHQNPAVGGLVNNLNDYEYSSYLDYIGIRKGTLCVQKTILDYCNSQSKRYEDFVMWNFDTINKQEDLKNLLLD